jgi:plasmid stability protein
MDESKRATIYFDADVHQALSLKAAAGHRSISALVNDAVRQALVEDAEDLAAADGRKGELSVSFAALVRDLRARGRI